MSRQWSMHLKLKLGRAQYATDAHQYEIIKIFKINVRVSYILPAQTETILHKNIKCKTTKM